MKISEQYGVITYKRIHTSDARILLEVIDKQKKLLKTWVGAERLVRGQKMYNLTDMDVADIREIYTHRPGQADRYPKPYPDDEILMYFLIDDLYALDFLGMGNKPIIP